jgi:hypothetical protein
MIFTGLPCRQHPVHAGGTDSDPLLAAAHPQPVELRAVQQLAEDQRDLLLHDSRSVVLDTDLEAVVARLLHVDPDFRQDPRLFAGVQRVVDGFFDRGQQRLARVVEPQQMPILGEKLADRDVPLLRRPSLRPWIVDGTGRWSRRIAFVVTSSSGWCLTRRVLLRNFGGFRLDGAKLTNSCESTPPEPVGSASEI